MGLYSVTPQTSFAGAGVGVGASAVGDGVGEVVELPSSPAQEVTANIVPANIAHASTKQTIFFILLSFFMIMGRSTAKIIAGARLLYHISAINQYISSIYREPNFEIACWHSILYDAASKVTKSVADDTKIIFARVFYHEVNMPSRELVFADDPERGMDAQARRHEFDRWLYLDAEFLDILHPK